MEHSIFCAGRADCSRFADGGYAGDKTALVCGRTGAWKLEIVKRSHPAGFEVLPKRWIVERTFAWISRNRRLARDFERYATTVTAFIRLAMIRIMLRRLAANASSWTPIFSDRL
jgi:putative transposase